MKNSIIIILLLGSFIMPAFADEVIQYGRFGDVHLYQKSPKPSRTVIFISGDGGWNQGVVGMAEQISNAGALVAGVDIVNYLRALKNSQEQCSYPAADFEALSKYLQKRAGVSTYTQPILIGYSSGATLAYAILSQAPPNTFIGGISLGFCPDLRLAKSLCKQNGLNWGPESHGTLFIFSPDAELESHWIAIQGEIDQVCNCDATAKFVSQVRNGSIVRLPHVGHGFSASRNWLPQVLKSYEQLANIPQEPTVAQKLPDLPLIEIKSTGSPKDILAVMITGDGGWASLDSKVGLELSQHGIPVVGLNSLHYFWKARTPDQAGQDLNRIVRKYLEVWNKDKVMLIGYSFGADVLPFMVNRLEPDLRKKVIEIAFLGPAKKASFEFHITDWLGLGKNSGYPVLSEILKLQPSRMLCVAGDQETDSVCKDVPAKVASKMELHGGHHFGGSYHVITSRILEEAEPSLLNQ